MYTGIMLALAAIMIYLQFRSNKADTFATRVFYALMALFVAVTLAGVGVIVSATYGTKMVGVATIAFTITIAVVIIEIAMLMIYLFFFSLMPPKWRRAMRFWWT